MCPPEHVASFGSGEFRPNFQALGACGTRQRTSMTGVKSSGKAIAGQCFGNLLYLRWMTLTRHSEVGDCSMEAFARPAPPLGTPLLQLGQRQNPRLSAVSAFDVWHHRRHHPFRIPSGLLSFTLRFTSTKSAASIEQNLLSAFGSSTHRWPIPMHRTALDGTPLPFLHRRG